MATLRALRAGLLAFGLAAGTVLTLTAAELAGTVTTPEGQPIAGALLDISTAAVKKGTSPLCPSCYRDCAKTATTDAEGAFTFSGLDDALRFQILVAAPGYQAHIAEKVDPAKGELKVTLQPRDPNAPALFRGRVVDAAGQPVAAALVSPYGWGGDSNGRCTRFGGGFPGEHLAVTAADGTFELASSEKGITDAIVLIRAPGQAPRNSPALRAGAPAVDIPLDEGVTVHGRLMRDGKPLANVNAGLVPIERACSPDHVFIPQVIGTDAQGRFTFTNQRAGQGYYVYGCRDSLPEGTVTRTGSVIAGAPGSTADAGDVEVIPGVPVTGALRLTDGKPLPKGVRLMLSRDDAWDIQLHPLEPDGRFRFTALPGEKLSFSARVRHYVYDQVGGEDYCNGPTVTVTADQGPIDIPFRHESQPPGEGTGLALRILTPDGKPAAGALAVVAAPGDEVRAHSDTSIFVHQADGGHHNASVADDDGRLRTVEPKATEGREVIAVHAGGYALVPYNPANPNVRLQPWGQLTGVLREGKEVVADATVRVHYYQDRAPGALCFTYEFGAETGPDGTFTIDRVIDGVGRLSTHDTPTDGIFSTGKNMGVETHSGQTTRVAFGGTGATVGGRVEIPAEVEPLIDRKNVSLTVNTDTRTYPRPPQLDGLPPAEREAQLRAFDEAIQRVQLTQVAFQPRLQDDNTFVIHDVPPGDYSLSVMFNRRGIDARRTPFDMSAQGSAHFTVTKDQGEVDLPPVEIRAIEQPLQPGDAAPAFTLHTLEGKAITGESLRGRPVVLYFVVSHPGEDQSDLKKLRALLESLPAKTRPATLVLIHGSEVPEAAKDPQAPWQAILLDGKNYAAFQAFHVRTFPVFYVLDPAGRITATCRRVDELPGALATTQTAAK